MPWQHLVANVGLEVDPETGGPWYREVIVTVPRQSGKTTLLKAVQTHRCVAWRRQRVTYTAQTRNHARRKWEDDFVVDLEGSPLSKLFTVRKSNGQEAIRWRNGSMWGIESTTESAGHGDTLDLGVIDEAFKQIDNRLEQAMKPAMITRPFPQLWVISTAGTADSLYLWSKVENGRQLVDLGQESRVAYFEWSAADEDDPADPATWWRCMPALGITVREDAVRADFDSMPLGEFERAYLNRWSAMRGDPVIPTEHWRHRDVLVPDSKAQGPLAFSIDVTPDRNSGSIGVSDGTHIELADHRDGTGWLLERAAQIDREHHPIGWVVDPAGPAGSLIPELVVAGLNVIEPKAREYAAACAQLYDAVVAHEVRHIGQEPVERALAAATRRYRGDVWTWARNDTTEDISPIVALTLARWGAVSAATPEPLTQIF